MPRRKADEVVAVSPVPQLIIGGRHPVSLGSSKPARNSHMSAIGDFHCYTGINVVALDAEVGMLDRHE
jgi:hypothetical protein